ncbi:MAG: glycosyltransferase family A protein [Candidatus Limnocylindrales bacterium]|jgi:glycosyltransferase involved in cell wall biosynthesis
MTVSVIVPTHNYARFLPEALESVRAQTYPDWECIVVDDGSTDETTSVLRAAATADSRVRYVSQSNRGPSAARNRGIAESTGEYVQFLDADDLLPSTKLEHQVRAMETDPSIGIVYSDARFFRGSPTDLLAYRAPGPRPSTTPGPSSSDALLRALIQNNIMMVEGPLVRRDVIATVGPFEESLDRAEDWQYWLRCALAGIRFVADPVEERAVLVRVHQASSIRNQHAMNASELVVRRWLDGRLDEPGLRRQNRKRTHATVARAGFLEGKEGSLTVGIRHLARAGIAERRPSWLLMACLLPLVRMPGADRVLALRRRLLRRPSPW